MDHRRRSLIYTILKQIFDNVHINNNIFIDIIRYVSTDTTESYDHRIGTSLAMANVSLVISCGLFLLMDKLRNSVKSVAGCYSVLYEYRPGVPIRLPDDTVFDIIADYMKFCNRKPNIQLCSNVFNILQSSNTAAITGICHNLLLEGFIYTDDDNLFTEHSYLYYISVWYINITDQSVMNRLQSTFASIIGQ